MESTPIQIRKIRILPVSMKLTTLPSQLPKIEINKINNHFQNKRSIQDKVQNNTKSQGFRSKSVVPSKTQNIDTPLQTELAQLQHRRKHLHNFISLESFKTKSKVITSHTSRQKLNPCIYKQEDSFNRRYTPEANKFYHKLLGNVELPRKPFHMVSRDHLDVVIQTDSNPVKLKLIQNTMQEFPKNQKFHENLFLHKSLMARKILSALKHYKSLNLHLVPFKTVLEYFPGVPYGLPKSREFIKQCKNGNVDMVNALLVKNKWLAHCYDFSKESALHWAVKRGHLNIVEILLSYKTHIDTNDSVCFIIDWKNSIVCCSQA